MELALEELITATGGTIVRRGKDRFASFHIDSRSVQPGGLFFALKGETTDGHLFVADAWKKGAGGVVVERDITFNGTTILVADSAKALHDAASFARSSSSATVIGITGSSGKTSTKEFTASLLAQKYHVFKSEGNLNSLTGMPLSLLSMEASQMAVFEVAMNHPGEIQTLSKLLKPDTGVVLNVNPVHLGQFSSVAQIADEKCSLVEGMSHEAPLIYNADDSLILQRESTRKNSIAFGFSDQADVRLTNVQMNGVRGSKGTIHWSNEDRNFETELCGVGNLYNIAAAAAVALLHDVSLELITDAIGNLKAYKQRGILSVASGAYIYDDSYNSNPKALELAFQLLHSSKGFGRKIAVVGDMLELGPLEQMFHEEAGKQATKTGVDVLIATGPLSKAMADSAKAAGLPEVFWVADSKAAAQIALNIRKENDLFLVKGSRGMKMETVTETLKAK